MNRFTLAAGGLFAVALARCVDPDPYAALVRAHAPVHYMDTDDTHPEGDLLTAIDFDGNWVTTDNWDHLDDPTSWTTGTTAVVYRSVVESCTHWFVVYAFYHPQDWADHAWEDEHENDVEGLLLVVRKDGTPTGVAEAMITVSHTDFHSFLPEGSTWYQNGADDVGTLSFTWFEGGYHPITSQEAKGHGLQAWPYAGDFHGDPGEDGVTYLPGDVGESPPSGDARDVRYQLTDLFPIVWSLALPVWEPFVTWGKLAGDESGGCGDGWWITCTEDAANLPWMWDDTDDLAEWVWDPWALQYVMVSRMPPGVMALDPARLVEAYFRETGPMSRSYVSNKYAESMRDFGYTDAIRPVGFPPDLSLDELYTHLGATCP